MSFFQRAATLAAMSLGIAGLIGVSTPGFAFELDRAINASPLVPVPLPAQIPAIAPQSAPEPSTPAINSEAPAPVVTTDDVEYASLDAAVADQDAPTTVDGDLRCMASAIYFESKSEPLAGQLAVAEVILNRTKSGRFPKSVCSVVTQRGQFSFVRGGHIPAIANNKQFRTAVAVAQVAMADHWDSPAANALYFHARRVAPGWRMSKVASIGNHVFYR
ncbi:cell wall hydrolase [Sphingomonas sp.]|uniref:cell wall hydrolase n=1 Tax=Sphingomonas sp. TaxID=28214 RepID=UPI003D6D9EB3